MQNWGETLENFKRILVTGRIRTDDLSSFAKDLRGYVEGCAQCAVMPGSTQEVSDVVKFLASKAIAFVPQGGNTGLCAGAIPDDTAPVVISLCRMNKTVAPDTSNLSVSVEAGAILSDIRKAAKRQGSSFPVDRCRRQLLDRRKHRHQRGRPERPSVWHDPQPRTRIGSCPVRWPHLERAPVLENDNTG